MIADLRHPVTIQQKVQTADGQGGFTTVWQDLPSRSQDFAEILDVRSSEQSRLQRLYPENAQRLRLRWRDDLKTDMRILFGTQVLLITGIADADGTRRYLELSCVSSPAVGTGL